MKKIFVIIFILSTFFGCRLIVPDITPYIAALYSLWAVPPYGLRYSEQDGNYIINQKMTDNIPSFKGTVNSFSVNPDLPSGITLNSTSGIISGTPTSESTTTNYIVKASNDDGYATTTISITVSSTSSTSESGYSIGGTISGLTSSGLILQNNSGDNLSITSGSISFTFGSQPSSYNVIVFAQPSGQTCAVSNGSGTANSNVTNISVSCLNNMYTIGGIISGLTGTVVLQNNGVDNLSSSADGGFIFPTSIVNGSTYSVTVSTQPSGQICVVSNGSGTASTNVTNVVISCSSSCSGSSITRSWGTFTDMCDGTIKLVITAGTYGGNTYTSRTMYFTKCSQGQVWNSSSNDCAGTGSSGDNYGATVFPYCNGMNNNCNGGTNSGILDGGGTSGAYIACSGTILAGKSWRVPTKEELKLLVECTDQSIPNDGSDCGVGNYTSPTFNNLFSNTVSYSYWSSSGSSASSSRAWYIDFRYGFVDYIYKTYNYYIRCASDG